MAPNYDKILKDKIDYYGETKAAYEFAADLYARELSKHEKTELAKLVVKMRNKQREYFLKRKTVIRFDLLKEAQDLEKQVDQAISEIIHGKTGDLFQ